MLCCDQLKFKITRCIKKKHSINFVQHRHYSIFGIKTLWRRPKILHILSARHSFKVAMISIALRNFLSHMCSSCVQIVPESIRFSCPLIWLTHSNLNNSNLLAGMSRQVLKSSSFSRQSFDSYENKNMIEISK